MTAEVFLLNRDNLLMTARSLNTEGDLKNIMTLQSCPVWVVMVQSPLSHLGPCCSRQGQDPWRPSSSCPIPCACLHNSLAALRTDSCLQGYFSHGSAHLVTTCAGGNKRQAAGVSALT